jgi:glycosyltransferase involved in cell wall biosynthesis
VGWIKQFNIGHIHAHFGTNSTEVVMLASELSGVPYSFTVHGCEEFDKPESIGLPEKIRRSKFVVAISSFARAQLYRWSDCISWKKVNVVHCALDPAYYRNSPPPILDRPRLLCIGRLCKEKGLPLLLMATAMLVKKGCTVELVLAGDGEMRAEIESLIVSNDLCGHVKITGWVDANRIRQELQNCRALVLASFAEGLPVVIMEALALGRPVLTTRIAGIPELVVHGKNGWLVPPGSVDALAEAMEECLTTPVAHLEKMGAWGRELVLQRHNDDHEAKKLVALFGFSPTTTSI